MNLSCNKIKGLQSIVFDEPMIEMVDLDLSSNRIKVLEAVKNLPKLETLNMNKNPLKMVFP